VSHRTVSGAHRTVRCASGATAASRTTVVCNRIQCATVRARVRARAVGAPDSLEAPQVRTPTVEPQWSADVAGAPDSVRCAMRQHTSNAIFGGWGYKYPQPPHIQVIQVSTLLHLTRAIAFNTRHTKEIKSSPNPTQSFSD
jgi:hypothetical protein